MHYVIGDVHGCYNEMMALLGTIEKEDPEAQIIFVGDFIDRGPDVGKVLLWCKEHITKNGKYQTVRGNHEQMAIDWFREWLWWRNEKLQKGDNQKSRMPQTMFDFSDFAMQNGFLEDTDKLKQIIALFLSFPVRKTLELESVWGKKVTFRIVHAFYETGDVSEEEQMNSNLWAREDHGNLLTDDIIVHGHTPTISAEYLAASPRNTKPGLVSYRRNDINVDGGCVFAKWYPAYPEMLCAIRLEDLKEIYAESVQERFLRNGDDKEARDRFSEYQKDYMERESTYRNQMQQQMGRPE